MKRYLVFSCGVLIACACTSRKSVQLEQAASIHNEMMLSAEHLEEWLNLQESDTTSTVPADSLEMWKAKLEKWEENVVEVPGNEGHHSHGHGEHHHDHSKVQVTDEQMLVIQQELSTQLKQLEAQVNPYRNK